jgi:prevent-host-death family protein
MAVVKISELKNRLSHYLRQVQRGESLLVSDRNRVIARIEPAGEANPSDADEGRWLADLERRGVIRRAPGKLPRGWLGRRQVANVDVVGALLDERRLGR